MDQAIVIDKLTKTYTKTGAVRSSAADAPITAVDAVSLGIYQGELFGLLGPNGAGKTTLVKMLATLIVPTSGSAFIAGHSLQEDRAIRATSGLVVSDERSFYWRLSVYRNLKFFASLYGLFGRAAEERISSVLDAVGLSDRSSQRFSDLSSGLRQRLAIARALLHEPAILFLDEPTRSLDPVATAAMHQLIRSLQESRDMTILLITHDLVEAEKLCARIALMHKAKVRAIGSPQELRRQLDPQRQYSISLSSLPAAALEDLQQLLPDLQFDAVSGDLPYPKLNFSASELDDRLTAVLDIPRRHNIKIVSIEGGPPPLDDVFAHYTSDSELPTQ